MNIFRHLHCIAVVNMLTSNNTPANLYIFLLGFYGTCKLLHGNSLPPVHSYNAMFTTIFIGRERQMRPFSNTLMWMVLQVCSLSVINLLLIEFAEEKLYCG